MTRSSGSSSAWRRPLGARRGELCALRWSDIDLDRGVVRIEASVVDAPRVGPVLKETKTHTRRGVALDASTVLALRQQLELVTSRAALGGVKVSDGAFVFSSEVDGSRPWRPEVASHRWDTIRRRAGLDGVRLHDLRHFQATMLLRAGVPVKNVSKRLGHRDAATTLNVYAHFLEEADRQSADLMGRLLWRLRFPDQYSDREHTLINASPRLPEPRSGLGNDRQASNPHSRLLQHDDGSLVEVGRQPVEVTEKQRRLRLRSARTLAAEQDQRRLPTVALREQDAEVRVG